MVGNIDDLIDIINDGVKQKLNLSDWQKTDRHISNLFVKSPTLTKRLSYNLVNAI